MTDAAIEAAVPQAAALVCAVTDVDHDAVTEALAGLDVGQLHAVAIVLAANVRTDRPLCTYLPASVEATTDIALAETARLFHTTRERILSRDRRRQVGEARAVAMTALRYCGMSSPAVGAVFDRDHSTVLSAQARVGENRRLHAAARHVAAECGWDRVETEEVA